METKIDLLTVGEAFEDLIFVDLPRLPGLGEEVKTSRFVRTIGGGALITAVAAARLGLRCGVVSGLSDHAAAFMRKEGIAVSNLRRRDELHAITAALSIGAERSYVTFNGINDQLEERLLRASGRFAARHVHFALYPQNCARWLALLLRLRSRRITTSWDFGWNEGLLSDSAFPNLLRSLDYLFLNEIEAVLYSGRPELKSALQYWGRQPGNVIVKLGDKGSTWPAKKLNTPALKARVVDTTGAGDAFNGGFLFALSRGLSPAQCLKAGNRVGARSTESAGGMDGLPKAANSGASGRGRSA
jgi:sugar/nucleoside kinase (ribokinase family)